MLLHELVKSKIEDFHYKISYCTLQAIQNLVGVGIPLENIGLVSNIVDGGVRVFGSCIKKFDDERLKEEWHGYKISLEEDNVIATPYNPNE